WVLLEPRRLDDTTLDDFVNNYAQADADTLHRPPAPLSPQLRDACKGEGGTYLQILVRLAVRYSARGDTTVADLYRRPFAGPLRAPEGEQTSDALLDTSSQLCLDTYWKDGYRKLPYADAPATRKALLRKLLDAGIVVPANRGAPPGEEPTEVQFFHDSMQSYLTAIGL